MKHCIHFAIARVLQGAVFGSQLLLVGLQPAVAEDFFQIIPRLAKPIGDITPPLRVPVPAGVPISVGLPPGGAPSDRFKLPVSTPNVRPGVDPFTNRDIPMSPN